MIHFKGSLCHVLGRLSRHKGRSREKATGSFQEGVMAKVGGSSGGGERFTFWIHFKDRPSRIS